MTRSLLLALALSASASAQALEGLPFTSFEARAPWASLFEAAPSVPAAMERAVGGEVAEALADGAASFSRELGHGGDPLAGGGVGGPDAFLAAILGFIPGFGLGHLVAGSISGFLEWLIVDIVLGVVLFYILPVLLLPTFALIYPLSILVLIVERIGEAVIAYPTAEAGGSVASIATHDDLFAESPARMAPNILSMSF